MTETEWEAVQPELVDMELIVWSVKNTDWSRIRRMSRDNVADYAPIHVEELITGQYFVHDGFHRALRTKLNGHDRIWARVVRRG